MQEIMLDTTVTYTIVYEDKLYVIEQVPARVSQDTGEEFFAPETVERIHYLIKGGKQPDRLLEAPVYSFV